MPTRKNKKSNNNFFNNNNDFNNLTNLNMNNLLTFEEFRNVLVFAIICLIITIVLIYKYATKNNEIVCDNYVLNSYLYTILAFVYIVIIGVILVYNNIPMRLLSSINIIGMIVMLIGMIIVIFACTYYLKTLSHDRQITLHILFLILLTILGFFSFYILIIAQKFNVLYPAIFITLGITITFAMIGYHYGDRFITVDFDRYLRYALLAIIFTSFIGPLLIPFISKPDEIMQNFILFGYVIALLSIIVFALLLMSHNKKLKENEKNCKKPNYPEEGYSLFIKIFNILQDVIRMLLLRKFSKKLGKIGKKGKK
jgi:hypothetical protein